MFTGIICMKHFIILNILISSFLYSCGPDTKSTTTDFNATYRVTFNSTWSSGTHSTLFPINAHFSGLIGVTQKEALKIWKTGSTPSIAIESMAELGTKTDLITLFQDEINNSQAENIISGDGIFSSPGSGRTFTSSDINNSPFGVIKKLTTSEVDSSFVDGGPSVGTFTFIRIQ